MSSSFTHGLLNFYMQDFTNSLFVINFHLHCFVVKEEIPYDSYHPKCETCFKPQKMITFINLPCVTETSIHLESSMHPVGQTGCVFQTIHILIECLFFFSYQVLSEVG